jgi:hypothetical protein
MAVANDISGRPWILGTATPATPVWKGWINVEHFEYVAYAAQGDTVVLKDVNGKIVWSAKGASDLEEVRSGKVGWINGLIPDTITTSNGLAIVIVYIK